MKKKLGILGGGGGATATQRPPPQLAPLCKGTVNRTDVYYCLILNFNVSKFLTVFAFYRLYRLLKLENI